jgi:hypothetical protein
MWPYSTRHGGANVAETTTAFLRDAYRAKGAALKLDRFFPKL